MAQLSSDQPYPMTKSHWSTPSLLITSFELVALDARLLWSADMYIPLRRDEEPILHVEALCIKHGCSWFPKDVRGDGGPEMTESW